MPYRITDACIACGNCLVACPEDAIAETGRNLSFQDNQRGTAFFYIAANCNECGNCREVCPSQAIVTDT